MSFNRAHVLELFTPGQMVTTRAAQPITLGTFVKITTGDDRELASITTAAAGDRVFGIAATDASTGDKLTVQRGQARCFRLPTTATIAAGALIQVGANGAPATATDGEVVAQALRASTGEHVDITLV